LRRDRLLLTLALQLTINNFISGPLFSVVLPVYVRETVGSAAALGFLLACQGGGLVLGAIGYGLVGRRFARRHLWLAGYLSFPLTYAVLAASLPLGVIAVVFAVVGVIGGPINPLLVTVRYERIPLELRGRVFGTFSAISQVAQPIGIAAAGAAIELVGLSATLTALAVASASLGLSLLALPVLREMDAGPGQPRRGALRP
jgi:MFS family permease